MALVAARDRAAERARVCDEELIEGRGIRDGLEGELERILSETAGSRERIQGLQGEVDRLNGILEQIYQSKTWKLHDRVERLRNRFRSR